MPKIQIKIRDMKDQFLIIFKLYHKTVKISTLYLNKKSDNILHGTRISRTLQKTQPSFCWNSGCRSSNNNCIGLEKLSKSSDLGVLGPSI